MPEPLSNQSGAEQELPQYIECLLSVSGDAAFLNTFDKAFRSGCGPQWADRPPNTKPRYSFHALFPVPEEIQRRGFLKAGRLWCAGYWEAGGDLCEMQVKRVLGERRYQELRRKLETELQTGGPNSASQLADLTAEMEQYRKALAELHSGEPRIITKGKLPDSHIVFLDEIFKASDGILNALLTALNERRYTNEGKTIHIPTISFFSASNEIPNFANPEEKILKPLYDRFELKVVTEYVEDRDARLTILKQKQAAQGTAQNPSAVISLAELQAMQDEVLQVRVPDQVNELMDDVLCGLRGKGIHISDRKYFNYAPIAQAKAWLSGRDTVEPSDLTTLCAYLWTAPEERTIIQSTLERMCNDPLKDRLDTILAEAVEGYQEFTDTADAPAARRIGKLRDEFMSLYITLSQMLSNAQSDAEREKINACLEELERYSKEAHASVQYSYVPLRELYDLKAS